MAIVVESAPAPTPEIEALLRDLDEALSGPYDADQQHGLSLADLFAPEVRFFVARHDGAAVGCGGVALLDGYAELKRMFVSPRARGSRAATTLLERLEEETRASGRSVLRLETGTYQIAALRFYERCGFQRCPAFGPYAAMPARAIELSLFYEKML